MKILLINTFLHHKNLFALRNYKNIELHETDSIESVKNLEDYDCVYSPAQPINASLYPNVTFMFGPHFSVFPDSKYATIKGDNSVYNVLCEWNYNIYSNNELTKDINLVTIPFGVDTEKFCEIKPIETREQVFIYYKNRDPQELEYVKQYLDSLNITYKIFGYSQRYTEEEYIKYLQNSKYGIWVDAHESQGFALQEALSCNVPLFVWNVKTMNQEYRSTYCTIPTTTIPHWDEKCGAVFYDKQDINNTFRMFLSNLHQYNPRQYILDNLSMEKCEKKFIDCIVNAKKQIT